jgi:hypothetical protein
MFQWCHFNLQFLWIPFTKRVKIWWVYVQVNYDCVCKISIKSTQFYKSYSKRSRGLDFWRQYRKTQLGNAVFLVPYSNCHISVSVWVNCSKFWHNIFGSILQKSTENYVILCSFALDIKSQICPDHFETRCICYRESVKSGNL